MSPSHVQASRRIFLTLAVDALTQHALSRVAPTATSAYCASHVTDVSLDMLTSQPLYEMALDEMKERDPITHKEIRQRVRTEEEVREHEPEDGMQW